MVCNILSACLLILKVYTTLFSSISKIMSGCDCQFYLEVESLEERRRNSRLKIELYFESDFRATNEKYFTNLKVCLPSKNAVSANYKT